MAAEGSPLKRILHKSMFRMGFWKSAGIGAGLGRFALTI
jgi:hypothetical protein